MPSKILPTEVWRTPPHDFRFDLEVAGCFCEWKSQFLLLKRAQDKDQGGMWGLPAGKLDPGEAPLEGVIRETAEETGIRLEPDTVRSLGKVYARQSGADFIFHIYAVQLGTKPTVVLSPEEHTEYLWVDCDSARGLPLMPGAPEVLAIYTDPT